MTIRKIVLHLTAILALFVGCDKTSHKEDAATAAIFGPIRGQVKALNNRDAPGAIAFMHPDAPGLDKTRASTAAIADAADLLYSIQSLTLESADDTEARVRFQLMTQKISGPPFRDNRVVGLHTLRKYQGVWKIYYTQVLKVDYLN